jgi:16S rRNA (guanine527-N7)-methyltransferase
MPYTDLLVKPDPRRKIQAAAEYLELVLTHEQVEKLEAYLLELAKWNKTYNLTAIKSVEDMRVQHIYDSLAILPKIRKVELQHDRKLEKVLDVGSGAGLPGIVLAIAADAITVTCIDTVQKKSAFVAHIAAKLNLDNLVSVHGRVEQLMEHQADLVISRAFASLSDFAHLAGKHVNSSGLMAAMKSKQVQKDVDELAAKTNDWVVMQVDQVNVPGMNAERYMVWLQRNKEDV